MSCCSDSSEYMEVRKTPSLLCSCALWQSPLESTLLIYSMLLFCIFAALMIPSSSKLIKVPDRFMSVAVTSLLLRAVWKPAGTKNCYRWTVMQNWVYQVSRKLERKSILEHKSSICLRCRCKLMEVRFAHQLLSISS